MGADKSTGKQNKITITNDKGRLSKEEIQEDGERCGQVQSGGREAEGADLRREWAGELLLQHEDNDGGREGEGQDIWRRQEGDQRQVRRHDQVAGREPARGGGRVPGKAKGGGGRL